MKSIASLPGLIVACSIAVYFAITGARNISELDKNADLNRYLSSSSDLIETFAEPLSSVMFDAFYSASQFLELPWLLPAVVALAVTMSIYTAQINSRILKFFWIVALVPMLSLVNLRNGLLFLFIPVFSGNLAILIAMLLHWSYLFFIVNRIYNSQKLAAGVILLVGSVLFMLLDLSFISVKLIHYLSGGEERQYGFGLFIYLGILWYGVRAFYKESATTHLIFDVILLMALMLAFFGLPTPSGRLAYLAILMSLFDLRHKAVARVGLLSVTALMFALCFQVYFFSSMTGLSEWTW